MNEIIRTRPYRLARNEERKTDRERQRDRDGETDRETERRRDRETERQRQRQRDRETEREELITRRARETAVGVCGPASSAEPAELQNAPY